MICDNCGQSEWVLTTMDIVEPDESRTRVRICYTCKLAELPEGWRKEEVPQYPTTTSLIVSGNTRGPGK